MSQAHAHQPPPKRRRSGAGARSTDRPLPSGGTRGIASVPELLSRRRTSAAHQKHRRGARPLLTFALGLAVGYGIASPLPRLLGPALAALLHAPSGIAAIVNPLGIGNKSVLVLGNDSIGDNTDVMFTVQIRDGITEITQVPRDTYIDSEQVGVMKANALFANAGFETAKAEVGRLLERPVQRHLKVNLDAVARIGEALGGIEVDVPKRMVYVDNAQGLWIDLYPGRQVLRGNDLEGFLRFRHDELGDLGRMERQRLVLAEVFRKLAQPATLAKLPELLTIAGEDIRTDLSPIEITQLVSAMTRSKLSTNRLPGRLFWEDNLSYWMPDSNQRHPYGNGEEPPL
jgi:LCP family protein required for cell wall assembly